MKITILCADDDSNYFKLNDPELDIWTRDRDAWKYNGTNPVICHPPCQQWSLLRHFANFNISEKMIAYHCWELITKHGGIFEHPSGSSFFKAVNADKKQIQSVDQHWWGFPTRKRTYLYLNHCSLLSHPLNFDKPKYWLDEIAQKDRSKMPVEFCKYLVDSIRETYNPGKRTVTIFEEPKIAPSPRV